VVWARKEYVMPPLSEEQQKAIDRLRRKLPDGPPPMDSVRGVVADEESRGGQQSGRSMKRPDLDDYDRGPRHDEE